MEEVEVNSYPETKAPVPSRKIKASEAPNISKILSGLTENGLGFGGLKFGGGEIEGPEGFSLLTEVEAVGVSEDWADNFTLKLLLMVVLGGKDVRNIGGAAELRMPAMTSCLSRGGKLRKVDCAEVQMWL